MYLCPTIFLPNGTSKKKVVYTEYIPPEENLRKIFDFFFCFECYMQGCQKIYTGVPGVKVNILGSRSVWSYQEKKCTCVLFWTVSETELFHCTVVSILCPILSFPPTYESVWSVSWLLWLLTVTLWECCKMCHRYLEMPNVLICCMLSSHELLSELMLMEEFSKMYYTRINCTNIITCTINTGNRNSASHSRREV
jgi:hypothetical protein